MGGAEYEAPNVRLTRLAVPMVVVEGKDDRGYLRSETSVICSEICRLKSHSRPSREASIWQIASEVRDVRLTLLHALVGVVARHTPRRLPGCQRVPLLLWYITYS